MPKRKSKEQRRASLKRALDRLTRDRAKKRSSWPRKRFADGSLWILHPTTLNRVQQIEAPDPEKGWSEGPTKAERVDELIRRNS